MKKDGYVVFGRKMPLSIRRWFLESRQVLGILRFLQIACVKEVSAHGCCLDNFHSVPCEAKSRHGYRNRVPYTLNEINSLDNNSPSDSRANFLQWRTKKLIMPVYLSHVADTKSRMLIVLVFVHVSTSTYSTLENILGFHDPAHWKEVDSWRF